MKISLSSTRCCWRELNSTVLRNQHKKPIVLRNCQMNKERAGVVAPALLFTSSNPTLCSDRYRIRPSLRVALIHSIESSSASSCPALRQGPTDLLAKLLAIREASYSTSRSLDSDVSNGLLIILNHTVSKLSSFAWLGTDPVQTFQKPLSPFVNAFSCSAGDQEEGCFLIHSFSRLREAICGEVYIR